MTSKELACDAAGSAGIEDEEALVQTYLAPLASGYPGALGLRDDCALLTPEPGTQLVLKTDPIAAGVHFFPDDAPEDIAWKALAVNVSDLAAKGAEPRAYLMALALPGAPSRDWMRAFARGLGAAQTAFGCHLIGGDTDRTSGPLTVSITVLGSVPHGSMIRRATARPGDLIYVTGTIGDATLGLRLRRAASTAGALGVDAAGVARLVQRYLRPQPALRVRDALRAHASAAMDVSDGLIKDLERMCRASGVRATITATDVPLSADAAGIVGRHPDLLANLLTGGDDYEVLMAVPPGKRPAFEAATSLRPIGRFLADAGTATGEAATSPVRVVDGTGAPMSFARSGWDHFDGPR